MGEPVKGSWSDHWEHAYQGQRTHSWNQQSATDSLSLIQQVGVTPTDSVIDIGGGDSTLAVELIRRGFTDLTVLDISSTALQIGHDKGGEAAGDVSWIRVDILQWQPERQWDVWHDRALFHFLTEPAGRRRYLDAVTAATRIGSRVIVGAFAADGPEACSGLPTCRYSAASLAAEFGDAFETVETSRIVHTTPTGVAQPFTWVALQRIRLAEHRPQTSM